MTMQKTLLVISGPSAVGKRPLIEALAARIPGMEEVIVLAERDRVFDTTTPVRGVRRVRTGQLRSLSPDTCIIDRVRGKVNALDVAEIEAVLTRVDLAVVVPFYRLGLALTDHPRVRALAAEGVRVITVFISPFSEDELACCDDQVEVLTLIMQGRDVERALAEAVLSRRRRVDHFATLAAWHRSTTLLTELEARSRFNHVFVMRNGHLPSTWKSDPPEGDAGQVLSSLLALICSP